MYMTIHKITSRGKHGKTDSQQLNSKPKANSASSIARDPATVLSSEQCDVHNVRLCFLLEVLHCVVTFDRIVFVSVVRNILPGPCDLECDPKHPRRIL